MNIAGQRSQSIVVEFVVRYGRRRDAADGADFCTVEPASKRQSVDRSSKLGFAKTEMDTELACPELLVPKLRQPGH